MYHSTAARVAAVLCMAMCCLQIEPATMLFVLLWNVLMDEPVADVRNFILRNFNKFITTGSVHDRPRAGRTPSMPSEVVMECAKHLKAGYRVWGIVDENTGVLGWKHNFYTTITEAATECEYIKGALTDYNVSVDYLRAKLHELDPSLKRFKVDYKAELDIHQKGSRMVASRWMLEQKEQHPGFLERVCWVDEWHMWCTPERCPLHIWADAHDERVKAVLPIPQLETHEKVLIRCVAVVNARLGPIHMEFTTGTTDLERDLVKYPRTHEYKVRLPEVPHTLPHVPPYGTLDTKQQLTLFSVHVLPLSIACYLPCLHRDVLGR